jgi:serine/threonine-protein kinase
MLERIGRYEVRGEVGRGAMGTVYEGFDAAIGRRVAIKMLRTEVFAPDQLPDLLARFKREAQSAGQLAHPNIVTIHEYGEQAGAPYIVMEFIAGQELGQPMNRGVRFSLDEVVRYMSQLLSALAHAHEHGVVHRDLKPSNLFLLKDGSINVVDFGVARIESSDLTETGAMLGTPAYMSPEQCLGRRVDHRSDLFSAGVILYQLLTGEKPFTGTTTTIIQKVLRMDPFPPSELDPTLSGTWDEVIAHALAKMPEARYQSAGEFAEAIAAARRSGARASPSEEATQVTRAAAPAPGTKAESPPPARPPEPVPQAPPPPSSRNERADASPDRARGSRLMPVALVVLAMGAGGAYYHFAQRTPAPEPLARAPAAPAAVSEEEVRRKVEERLRREFEQKAAAQQATAARQAREREAAEKAAREKAAAERAAAEEARRAAEAKRQADAAEARRVAEAKRAAEAAEARRAEEAKREAAAAEARRVAEAKRAAEAAEARRAEEAKREAAAAEARRRAVIASAPAAPTAWSGRFSCDALDSSPEQSWSASVSVEGNAFKVGYGAADQPGSAQMHGVRQADGGLALSGSGISASATSYGRTHTAQFSGRFSGNRFAGRGYLGARACSLAIEGR